MTNDELKLEIISLIRDSADEWTGKDSEGHSMIYLGKIADVLISEGLIFKKDYRKSRSAELARQEQFAEEQGFTPDCSPYYIALQYKQRLSDAEYWKSVYDLALNIAFTGEERAYYCKKAEEELNKERKD